MEQWAHRERGLENREWRELRRGWCLGEPSFRERLLTMIGKQTAEPYYGVEIRESAEQQAERLLQRQLKEADWTVDQLEQRRKCDPVKVRIAQQLRQETTVTWKWIAGKLHMGHWRSAANAVRLAR